MRGISGITFGLAAVLVAAGGLAGPAAAVPWQEGAPALAVPAAAGRGPVSATVVTLITGDRVRSVPGRAGSGRR